MRYDLLIRNATFVTDEGASPMALAVADGQVAALAPELDGSAAVELDARGLLVLPGLVDVHVHFNEPGRTHWEGIATGSAALAAGGGTCFCDMPLNAAPPTLDAASFDLKHRAAAGQSATDFGLWGGLVPGPLDRLDALADRGVVGFKAFMADPGIPDFACADEATLHDGMVRAARLGLPVAVHAEDEATTARLARQARRAGRTGVRDFLRSRPVAAEVEAIRRAAALAEATGCALHVVHVSSGAGVAVVAEARARGVDVSAETCPHYLMFTEADVERLGAVLKCAPPIRTAADRDALWAALQSGGLDLVASDHSPAPPALKASEDFFAVWGGIAGVQATLAVLLAEGHVARGVPLARVATLAAGAPAARFRLPGKGRVAVGYDADLVLVDLQAAEVLQAAHLRQRHPLSPDVGQRLHGQVRRTLVRGQSVYADGRDTGARPGRLVRPGPQ